MRRLVTATVALAAAATLSACGTSTSAAPAAGSTPSDSMSKTTDAMTPKPSESMTDKPGESMTDKPGAMAKGRYISYADYTKDTAMAAKGAHVVLFFHAPWCPDCKATDASLTSAGIPDGLTVVKVDYDSMTDLKQKYGITQQHTFVQVDEAGMKQSIWTGSKTGADILAKTS